MSYTLVDYALAFDELKKDNYLAAGAQSLYWALLLEFNRAFYPTELVISIRELQVKTGLKSTASVHESRRTLKNLGLIDFHKLSRSSVSAYRLLTEHVANANRTRAEQQANANRTREAFLRARARQDVKTLETSRRVDGVSGVREEVGGNGHGAAEHPARGDWAKFANVDV